jgi:ATP-dependent RNA helicase RhlE
MNATNVAAEAATTPSFNDLPLATFLKETCRELGYEKPTPIQSQAIPMVLEGHDLIGLAQTGTGKTAAFVLPLLEKLSGRKERVSRALILAPTRELAEQINDSIKALSPRTGIRSVTVYGGVSHRNQITQLRANPAIIVACPGRLMDHIHGDTVDLSGIEYLVLDEADRMLDMGFLPNIKEIIRSIPKERQTMLFSATMPDEIKELSGVILKDPKVVQVKSELPVALVTHSMYSVKQEDKPETLKTWLKANAEAVVVVFTQMKHVAKRLGERLAKDGIPATSLQGNLSQGQRQRALNGFKRGEFRVLIATDIASRGIDVDGVSHVINYDMPDTLEAYIHRTGRAGRASRTGDAISFVTRSERGMLRSIEKWLQAPIAQLNAEASDSSDTEVSDEAPTRRRRPNTRGQKQERSARRPGRKERMGMTEGARDTDREGSPRPEQQRERRGRPEGRSESRRADFRERSDSAPRGRGQREWGSSQAPRGRSERSPERSSERSSDRGFGSRSRGTRDSRFEDRGRSDSRRERPFNRGSSSSREESLGARSTERPARRDWNNSRGGQGQRPFGRRPSQGGDRPNRPSGSFRGQRDIDSNADYVYRPEPPPHFIDRSDSEGRGSNRGRPSRAGGPRRPNSRGFQRRPNRS